MEAEEGSRGTTVAVATAVEDAVVNAAVKALVSGIGLEGRATSEEEDCC